jgi:DNA polymerase I-like protein with 3'-5' exonuclease and polymerase domains
LKVAVESTERPWEGEPPDLLSRCQVITDDKAANRAMGDLLTEAAENDMPVAWDLETNCLKPDNKDAAIASCSLAIADRAIAFPWSRVMADAVKGFLESNFRKIASNMKFEDRWARRVIGCRVRNWWHDTMLAAHLLDNRKAVTSIKFQAFVHLGMEDYDSVVKPYLQSKESGGYAINRVFQCDWPTLLRYNALDSLLEYEVAVIQRKLMFLKGEK